MISKLKFLLFGYVLILFTSCKIASTATNKIECMECLQFDKQNLIKLNGNYDNQLWKYIAPLRKKYTDLGLYVKLTVINNSTINAQLMIDDSTIVARKKIKGRIKNGQFSVRTKVYPIGIPVIYFNYYSNKIDLALTNSNELNMIIQECQFAWILLITAGDIRNF